MHVEMPFLIRDDMQLYDLVIGDYELTHRLGNLEKPNSN